MLPPIDLCLRPNETWALIGRNGAGKTTLLKTLLGLLPRLGGVISLSPGVHIGYVPQRQTIDPAVPERVWDVIAGGLDTGMSFMNPTYAWSSRPKIHRVLKELGIADLRRRQFSDLSEGQKQRVLIGRAIVGDPALLVLDEPTSAMDLVAESAIFNLLGNLKVTRGLALIVVSHQLSMLAKYATHALLIDREAKVVLAESSENVLSDPRFAQRYGATVAQMLRDELVLTQKQSGLA